MKNLAFLSLAVGLLACSWWPGEVTATTDESGGVVIETTVPMQAAVATPLTATARLQDPERPKEKSKEQPPHDRCPLCFQDWPENVKWPTEPGTTEPTPPTDMITDLPPLGPLEVAKTVEGRHVSSYFPEGKVGQFVENDNNGDGTYIVVGDMVMGTFRSGVPATKGDPNGCQFQAKPWDGQLITGWGSPFGGVTGPGPQDGLARPWKAITSNHYSNRGNIDTGCMVYLEEATGGPIFISVHGVKPGGVTDGQTGRISEVHGWQTTNPDRKPDSWTWPSPGTPLISGLLYPEATWAQAYPDGAPNDYNGGCKEPTIFYESDNRTVVMFWEGQFKAELEWNGSTRHHAIGRAECPIEEWGIGLTPTMQWTPKPSENSYVWRPREDGMRPGEVYGTTNETAVFGTSERVTPRAHIARFPDGSYHMLVQQKTPNTGGGKENKTAGVAHYYSHKKGVKGSWIGDKGNPILTWATFDYDPDNGSANKLNSPHFVVDPNGTGGWIGIWGNGTPDGMNSPGTDLFFIRFDFEQ